MQPQPARELGTVIKAKKDVIGAKVVNLAGEDIGTIEEVMLDAGAARITYAIVSFGGFLGVGNKLFAVPWVSLNYDGQNACFSMKADKELLKNAPGFDKDRWPNLSDPTRASEIYRYYDIDEYWL
jgi:sporulation protein YlmC with PRC-barrel domain